MPMSTIILFIYFLLFLFLFNFKRIIFLFILNKRENAYNKKLYKKNYYMYILINK